jgi:hypothetical protein
MMKIARKNRTRSAVTVRTVKGTRIASEAGRSAGKEEEIYITKRLITPAGLPSIVWISIVINTANNIMSGRPIAATDPRLVDNIAFLGCPTCRPWSS